MSGKVAKAGRHLPQVELPAFVPIPRLGEFERRGTNFNLVHSKNVVLGAEGRAGKNGGIEFNLAEAVFDLENPADTEGPVE
jgi:hypothetical protein